MNQATGMPRSCAATAAHGVTIVLTMTSAGRSASSTVPSAATCAAAVERSSRARADDSRSPNDTQPP
jgi:hypothetical protein